MKKINLIDACQNQTYKNTGLERRTAILAISRHIDKKTNLGSFMQKCYYHNAHSKPHSSLGANNKGAVLT
jgi:hypothetical protein